MGFARPAAGAAATCFHPWHSGEVASRVVADVGEEGIVEHAPTATDNSLVLAEEAPPESWRVSKAETRPKVVAVRLHFMRDRIRLRSQCRAIQDGIRQHVAGIRWLVLVTHTVIQGKVWSELPTVLKIVSLLVGGNAIRGLPNCFEMLPPGSEEAVEVIGQVSTLSSPSTPNPMAEQSPPPLTTMVPSELKGNLVLDREGWRGRAPILTVCVPLVQETASWNWKVLWPRPCGKVPPENPPQ